MRKSERGYFVYKYVFDDEIVYVGKTDASLFNRVVCHSKEKKFQPFLNSSIFFTRCANKAETAGIEMLLINAYKPKLNTAAKYETEKIRLNVDEIEWEYLEWDDTPTVNDAKTRAYIDSLEHQIEFLKKEKDTAWDLLHVETNRTTELIKQLGEKYIEEAEDNFEAVADNVFKAKRKWKRDKRLQLLVPDELYKALRKCSTDNCISMNEIVNQILEAGLRNDD